MNKITRRTVIASAITLSILPKSSLFAQAPQGWRKLPTVPYKGKQDDISFVDVEHGWYGNGEGKLYRTTD
ncbi:hypothetical protein, partial [Sphingorhabdus sp.]